MMLRRKVVEVLHNRECKEYNLKLECTHEVKRRDSGPKRPPASTYCDACLVVLDRLAAVGDYASASQVKTTVAVLSFLEQEGLVKLSRGYCSHTRYWKKV